MRKLLDMLLNAVFVLAALAVTLLVALGLTMKSFGATRPAIYYPNAPDITVMQIDTGVDYNIDNLGIHIPEKYHSADYMDVHGHGTHVAGIILKNTCLNVKLIPCRFYGKDGDTSNNIDREIACLETAIKDNVDVINMSIGGQYPNKNELDLLKKLDKKNVVVVVAAGNDVRGGHKLTMSNDVDAVNKYLEDCNELATCDNQRFYRYPASYIISNLLKVANYHNGSRVDTSNYAEGFLKADGQDIESYAIGGATSEMTGTSQSAASVTNKILKDMCNSFK